MYTTLSTALICALFINSASAGSLASNTHQKSLRDVHRRHRHRISREAAEVIPAVVERDESSAGCENGKWKCVGSILQRCSWDNWLVVQDCTGQDVVCSDDPLTTGCVWTWSVDPAKVPTVPSSPIPSNAPVLSPPTSGDSCDDDEGAATSSVVATTRASASPTSSPSAGNDDTTSSNTSSTITPSASVPTPTASVIGGNLAAQPSWYSQSVDPDSDDDTASTSSSASYDDGQWHPSSSSMSSEYGQWQPSSSSRKGGHWQHTSSSYDDGQWHASSVSSDDGQWQSSSATYDDGQWHPSSTSDNWSASSTSSTVRGGQNSASATATASVPRPTKTSSPSTGGSSSWSAPHYVIYSDRWLGIMPEASDLTTFNRFILAFWMSDRGAVDNAQLWEQFTEEYRQQVIADYHAAGVALMVSAFGSTDAPTMNGVDPTSCAQDLAAWVKQYSLDGVDIDYEDMPAMNSDRAEAWIITFQTELRRLLPSGQFLISHAPVAPWFTSASDYASGAYYGIHAAVGNGIDFYSVQFYNQGNGVYEDCQSLIFNSGSSWPSTSLMEINSYAGVPLNKIVLGKPLTIDMASNGYLDPYQLATCVQQAQAQGWNGGVMFWEWTTDAPVIMATVRGM